MEAVSRYKRVIKDIATVYGLFLCYKNTTPTHYKQLVSGWGIDELCSLLSEVEAINIEEIKQELFSLDGEPLKRFVKDLREYYIPNYGAVIESLKSDELLAILEKIHGSKKAHLIIDNLTAIAMTAITKIGNVALILSELQPQVQPQRQAPREPSNERAKRAFAKAVEAGYMEKTETGYKWLYLNGRRGSNTSLGYFLVRVYDPDNKSEIPMTALQALFGVKRLDRATNRATTPQKPQKWRGAIDELLKDI